MGKRSVIFDMDGVLFDTERLAIKIYDSVGEKLGFGKAGYMVYKTLGLTADESKKVWKNEFGSFSDEDFAKYKKQFVDFYYSKNEVPIKDGVYPLLEYLKKNKYKVALASSTRKERVMSNLKSAGITDCFDVIVCGDMVTKSKPSPDIYITACKMLEVAPNESYAVEDSKFGLLSALNAGCDTVMVPDLWTADDEILSSPVMIMKNLNEFKEYLMNEN